MSLWSQKSFLISNNLLYTSKAGNNRNNLTPHGGVFYRREMSVNKKCHRDVIFLLINIESRHILLTIMHVNSLKKNVLGQKKTSTRDGGH